MCQADMKIVAFIETADIIEMIGKHLGLWDQPGENPAQTVEWIYDDDEAQPPSF
jgi:hypothetical protein